MLFCWGFFEKSFENYGVLGNSINFKALAVLLVKPGSSFSNFGSNILRILREFIKLYSPLNHQKTMVL